MTREEARLQLAALMAYIHRMTGEEPDYSPVWNRIQGLTDYVFCHEPDPGEWEMPEGFKKFLERIKA